MIFRFAHAAARHQRLEHHLVSALVEGGEPQPRSEVAERFITLSRCANRQLAQHRDVQRTIALSLRHQPAGELRVAIDTDAVEQVAAKQIREL